MFTAVPRRPGAVVALHAIARRIHLIRGQRVMLSTDLATLYGIEPRMLVQAVKRNLVRFPEDFMFQLTGEEAAGLKSQSVISKRGTKRRTQPMDPRLTPLAETLRLNSRLYRNCLAGFRDEQAQKRPSGAGPTNSAAFVAAHLVDSRYYLLDLLGVKQPSPLKGAPKGFNDIDQVIAFPPLSEIQAAWTAAGEALDRQLGLVNTATLDAPLDPGFPIERKSLLGVLVFLVQHESYHLGQLGLLRKHAGLPAMAYD